MEIKKPVPNLETEWVVLEKDRYIRQRVNSRIAQKNFSRIEIIKEELKRMKYENEEILFNAEFGFDTNIATESSLFSSIEDSPPNDHIPRKVYTERFVSWNGNQKNGEYTQRPTNVLEKSYSMDDVFQMTFENEFEEKSRDIKSKKNSCRDGPYMTPRNQLVSAIEIGTQKLARRSQGNPVSFDKSHFDLESKRRVRRNLYEETNL